MSKSISPIEADISFMLLARIHAGLLLHVHVVQRVRTAEIFRRSN